MKKIILFATATLMLAACTSDEFVGEDSLKGNTQAIAFTSNLSAVTRAEHVGADAANLLHNTFTVGGFKGTYTTGQDLEDVTTATGTVFDNYIVNWTENTAATTESNTSDWEYVGLTAEDPSSLSGNTQSIKYWDYTATQYDFIAYSTGTATKVTAAPADGEVQVTAIDPTNATTAAFTLTGKAADLEKCYISDMKTVYKTDFQKEVQLTFRSLASKVRIAIYETIPGYSVKDVKFYTDATTPLATGGSATSAALFTTGDATKDKFYTAGTYTVYYPTIGAANVSNPDYNQAHVSFAPSSSVTLKQYGTLNYTATKDYKEKSGGTIWVARSASAPSYAGIAGSNYYSIAMPNEEGTVLELRIDYTLESIDGSGEEIKVHGATAFVPAIYAAWKSNFAYTYIFKISDNTNGWTSTLDTDPAGLYPITFDAVVTETTDYNQSTITTVASPSITAYQKGRSLTADEFAAGDIYIQVIAGGALKNDLGSKGQLYTLSRAATEAEVMDALNIQAASDANTITGRNGLVLTKATSDATITAVPGEDGSDITVTAGTAAQFAATANTYAYVYDATPSPAPAASYYYSAEALTSAPTDWGTAGVWYADPNGATAAPTTFAAGTYYKKYTNLNNVYGVKVIKVQ